LFYGLCGTPVFAGSSRKVEFNIARVFGLVKKKVAKSFKVLPENKMQKDCIFYLTS
jgi:hypothetical protein